MSIIGLGIDLCKNSRIQRILDNPNIRTRFLQRILHPEELTADVKADYVASRWAVKEALVKAVAVRKVRFAEVHVKKEPWGQPYLSFEGATKAAIESLGVARALVSLSHEQDISVGVVILLGKVTSYPLYTFEDIFALRVPFEFGF